jgi:hypothetical protein
VPFFVYYRYKNYWGQNVDILLWGYMDQRGREVIKPILVYYAASRVWAAGLPPEGKILIEPRSNTVGPFHGGIARVEFFTTGLDNVYGYINRQGQFIWRSTE